jgi:heme oxygenase
MDAVTFRDREDPDCFRFQLRRSTRTEHEALDAHPAFKALLDGTLSIAGYTRLMAIFLAFYRRHDTMLGDACVEHKLQAHGYSYAPRTTVLSDDLVRLGIDDTDGMGLDTAPLPPLRNAGTLVGILYVLEGSLLGGSVLFRSAQAVMERHGSGGDGYWRWCREAGATRWAMTCGMIEAVSLERATRADMISGASSGFSTFARWLDRWADDYPRQGPMAEGVGRC